MFITQVSHLVIEGLAVENKLWIINYYYNYDTSFLGAPELHTANLPSYMTLLLPTHTLLIHDKQYFHVRIEFGPPSFEFDGSYQMLSSM